MTAKELITILQTFPENMEVVTHNWEFDCYNHLDEIHKETVFTHLTGDDRKERIIIE